MSELLQIMAVSTIFFLGWVAWSMLHATKLILNKRMYVMVEPTMIVAAAMVVMVILAMMIF